MHLINTGLPNKQSIKRTLIPRDKRETKKAKPHSGPDVGLLMPHQTPQSSITTVFQLNIMPLPLAAPTTSSSASVTLDLQATFVKYFGIDPTTIDYTDREQKQVLSLLDRVLHNNPDSPVQKLCEGPDVIPFGGVNH